MKVDVREEQLLTLEFYAVRNADIADVTTWSSGADCLDHRLLSADALQNRVCSHTLRQIVDAGHTFITALFHDVGRAELQSKLLSLFMAAHGDDPFCPHLPGGEPTGPKDIGGREKVRNRLFCGNSGSRHESAVRKRNT